MQCSNFIVSVCVKETSLYAMTGKILVSPVDLVQ